MHQICQQQWILSTSQAHLIFVVVDNAMGVVLDDGGEAWDNFFPRNAKEFAKAKHTAFQHLLRAFQSMKHCL